MNTAPTPPNGPHAGAPKGAQPASKPHSALDDSQGSAHAWNRFRRILRAMAAAGMAVALAVTAGIWWDSGPLPWAFVALTVAGIWATFMMAALLMGLMFLSSGTGHDSVVEDRVSEDVLESHED